MAAFEGSYDTKSKTFVDPKYKAPEAPMDWGSWAGAIGGGALGYALGSRMVDEDEEDKKKRSAWEKLLSVLIPVGISGLGAYGGYRLAKNAGISKKAQTNEVIGIRQPGQYSIPVMPKPTLNGVAKNWVDLVENRSRKEQIPLKDAFGEEVGSDLGWALGEGLTAGTLGSLGGAGELYGRYLPHGLEARRIDRSMPDQAAIDAAKQEYIDATSSRQSIPKDKSYGSNITAANMVEEQKRKALQDLMDKKQVAEDMKDALGSRAKKFKWGGRAAGALSLIPAGMALKDLADAWYGSSLADSMFEDAQNFTVPKPQK